MGGIPEILKSIGSMMIGSWLYFHSTMMNIKNLYRLKSDEAIFEKGAGCTHEIDQINIKDKEFNTSQNPNLIE